ncbi:LysR substrate-binding domain-containing protein [Mycobacterium sp. 236(2023)]|uniref:LysR family transcriptional regulator n=1 Tax=Mycobacterium sp. 236(2023) TaxID=3038163 RepID=UPI00241586AC|nr:LysR substrate-binding domain-containing protein [Mycobacterium sp. 236(2023)]MDG4663147.1 LysR substrate-binding domain-containing protein [Mycobacterium sp. 236(2023)]
MLEVREARYFIAVAEELNFGRAAERLQMSQPPLSAAVKAIEKRLGVLLLNRTTRHVVVTPAGTVFLERCRRLVAAAQDAESATRLAAEGQLGELRIGAVSTAFTSVLPKALALHGQSRPNVDVSVREVDTHYGSELLARREIDIAVVRHGPARPWLHHVTLTSEPFVLAAPAGWRLPRAVGTDLASAADLPWVWIPRGGTPDYHDQVAACCRDAGFTPQAKHLAQSISSQLSMVAAGLGVALVPASSVAGYDAIASVRVRSPLTIAMSALYRTDSDVLVTEFIDALVEASRRN